MNRNTALVSLENLVKENGMFMTRFAVLTAVCLLASCGSSSHVPGAPTHTQEFDPNSNRWITTSRVVVPPPSQPAAPMVIQQPAPSATVDKPAEKEGLLRKTGHVLKKPLKWIPGVD